MGTAVRLVSSILVLASCACMTAPVRPRSADPGLVHGVDAEVGEPGGEDAREKDLPDMAGLRDTPRDDRAPDGDARDDGTSEVFVDAPDDGPSEVFVDAQYDVFPEILVDGVNDRAADSDACQPRCGGANCGDDGCGGTCGSCPTNLACDAGRCLPPMVTVAAGALVMGCNADAALRQAGMDASNLARVAMPGTSTVLVLPVAATTGCPDGETQVGTDCSGLTDAGCCRDTDHVLYCNGGVVCERFCTFDYCRWPIGSDRYSCSPSDDQQADPSGVFPRECPCIPECVGHECGDDGCGGSCGQCAQGLSCVAGRCVCQPQCGGKDCGPDGCGNSCGSCPTGPWHECRLGTCICTPDCTGRSCGGDGCGGSCGQCPSGKVCEGTGVCIDKPCTPDCFARSCGDDGCGGSCGVCPSGKVCYTFSGQCVTDSCTPACSGKECGDDGCGGSCGTCPSSPQVECREGRCLCTPDCTDRECGTNGCNGSCGTCPVGQSCGAGTGRCVAPTGGCPSNAPDDLCGAAEHPCHPVEVPAFEVDTFEVTVAAYAACVDAGHCTVPDACPANSTWGVTGREQHPVDCVNWLQADGYCRWAGRRLCTEAEWEKAARGTDGRLYPWGNTPASCILAVMHDGTGGCGSESTWPVGSRSAGASPYGVMDMAGNASEWVQDRYHGTYEGAPLDGSAWDNPGDTRRVIRGGRFVDAPGSLRSSSRLPGEAADGEEGLGLRCCRAR